MQSVSVPASRRRARQVASRHALASFVFASAIAAPYQDVFGGSVVTVTNPVLHAPAQDPQVVFADGRYYYCESSKDGIFLRAAADFAELGKAPRVRVWAPPVSGGASRNIWAPELHVLDGRCYIYFAADDGNNANHRMWVLEARTSDVLGAYDLVGSLDTGGWAIDGTILTDERGERFFIWSGWPGRTDGQQNLYISRMASPTRLAGRRVVLATPDQSWERHGMPICEGPQVLSRDGKFFVIYSASGSWTPDYCLGMLVYEGGDLMNPASWKKAGQVFARNEHAWGIGHCGFLTTAEGEDWIFYHSKTLKSDGWDDREVRAQPFSWTAAGRPDLGAPVDPSQPLLRTTGYLTAAQTR